MLFKKLPCLTYPADRSPNNHIGNLFYFTKHTPDRFLFMFCLIILEGLTAIFR